MKKFFDGEITAEEMAADIVKDTAVAGALGYGSAFITKAITESMQLTSNQLIRSVGGSCLPAAAVSFAVESYDDIANFAQGKVTPL